MLRFPIIIVSFGESVAIFIIANYINLFKSALNSVGITPPNIALRYKQGTHTYYTIHCSVSSARTRRIPHWMCVQNTAMSVGKYGLNIYYFCLWTYFECLSLSVCARLIFCVFFFFECILIFLISLRTAFLYTISV